VLSAHSLENIHVLKHCGRTIGTSGMTGGDGVPLEEVAGTTGADVVGISPLGLVVGTAGGEVAGVSPTGEDVVGTAGGLGPVVGW